MIWPNAIKYVNNPCQVLKWSTLIFKQLEHICSNFNTWGRKLLTKNSLIWCSFYSFNHCFFWLTNHCFNFIGLLLRTIFVPFLFFFVEPIFFNSISLHSFIHSFQLLLRLFRCGWDLGFTHLGMPSLFLGCMLSNKSQFTIITYLMCRLDCGLVYKLKKKFEEKD